MRIPITLIVVMGVAISGHARARPDVGPADTPASSPLSPNRAPKSEIRCVLTVEPIIQLYTIPSISVVLTNQTDTDIYLVGSLDGSDARMRYPHCYFEVIGPDGKPASGGIDRCGNVGYLRETDFVRVPPGGSFNPYHAGTGYSFFLTEQIKPYTFRVPGKYRLRFFYSTASEDFDEWAGGGSNDLAELLRLVPRLELASNETVVEVVGPTERR